MLVKQKPKVYLFWDNSNIYISAQQAATFREPNSMRRDVRVDFQNLFKLAVNGRPIGKAIAVGSVPPDHQGLWDKMKANTGITAELYERGASSGTEQGVDQCIQTHMLRALADESEPQVAVLLTGDGKGYHDGVGFHADLERMQKRGWGIEVIAWDRSCNVALKTWAQAVGIYIKLDDYYDAVTFLSGTRSAKSLNLQKRAVAEPKAELNGSASQMDIIELRKQINIDKYNKRMSRRRKKN